MEEGNERELDTLTEPGIKGLKRGNLRRILLLLGILVMALLGLRQGLRMQTATVEPTQLPKQDAVFQPVVRPRSCWTLLIRSRSCHIEIPDLHSPNNFPSDRAISPHLGKEDYVRSWASGGHADAMTKANQLLELFKLVHLAEKLDRTAVLYGPTPSSDRIADTSSPDQISSTSMTRVTLCPTRHSSTCPLSRPQPTPPWSNGQR